MTARVRTAKGILWAVAGLAAGVTIVRFTRGLGATTALSDATPWGLWIGFDVMGGVALAAGGFVVAGLAHIFQRGRYHHAVRPAVLTALLGYGAVVVGLLYDLGLPWNIWHLTIFWNPRSPLFEVGWCVMLYLTVLVLEFTPVFLERTRFQRLYRTLLRLQLPLIILGIALSTLHQSSLGTLILIMPFRVHELWYTPLLPELFFVTAICLGLAMVIFESTVTSWLYERKPQTDLVSGLARLAAYALAFQLVFRLGDLWRRGDLARAFDGGRQAGLFQLELLLSSLLPLALFAVPSLRRRATPMFLAASACVAGFLLHRVNVSGLAHVPFTGSPYFPSWTEFVVSFGIVSAAALAFLWIQEHFPVDPEALDEGRAANWAQLFELPRVDAARVLVGDAGFGGRRVYSLAFTLTLALGLALTSWQPLVQASPVERARGGDLLRVGFPQGTVRFPHAAHIARLQNLERAGAVVESPAHGSPEGDEIVERRSPQGEAGLGRRSMAGEGGCSVCHHANKPGDEGTPCSECHADLYLPTRVFEHGRHVEALRGNASCALCHASEAPTSAPVTRECSSCHPISAPGSPWAPRYASVTAPGLRPAAHRLCIGCHKREALRLSPARPDLPRCATCHRTPVPHEDAVRPATPASHDVTRE